MKRLYEACKNGDLKSLEEELLKGADPTADNNLAIRIAAANGHLDVVNRLLEIDGVNPKTDSNYAINTMSENSHFYIVDDDTLDTIPLQPPQKLPLIDPVPLQVVYCDKSVSFGRKPDAGFLIEDNTPEFDDHIGSTLGTIPLLPPHATPVNISSWPSFMIDHSILSYNQREVASIRSSNIYQDHQYFNFYPTNRKLRAQNGFHLSGHSLPKINSTPFDERQETARVEHRPESSNDDMSLLINGNTFFNQPGNNQNKRKRNTEDNQSAEPTTHKKRRILEDTNSQELQKSDELFWDHFLQLEDDMLDNFSNNYF